MNIGLVDWKGYFDRNIYVRDSKIYDENGDLDQNEIDTMKFYIYRDFTDWIKRFKLDKLVIAFESGNWRKQYFPLYKFRRKLKRSKSNVENWEFWFQFAKDLEAEFKQFPFIVCHHPKLEADDVNAILAKYYTQNNHKVVLFATDQDYNQLFRYNSKDGDDITLYNTTKDILTAPIDYRDMLYKAIIQGQRKDDIPSGLKKTLVKESFVEKVIEKYPEFSEVSKYKLHKVINQNYKLIQPLVGKYTLERNEDVFEIEKTSIEYENAKGKMVKATFPKYVKHIKDMGFDEWLHTIDDPIVLENIKRNQVLMDFEKIPQQFRDDVLKYVRTYDSDNEIVDNNYLQILSYHGFNKIQMFSLFNKMRINDNNEIKTEVSDF